MPIAIRPYIPSYTLNPIMDYCLPQVVITVSCKSLKFREVEWHS